MSDVYVQALADELCATHAPLLASAENDLALLRARLALVTTWIHNPTYDATARATTTAQTDLAHTRGAA